MKTTQYHLTALTEFLSKHKVATMEQMRAALGEPARCTVFRKLSELEALNSYSHRGKYYTLKSIARFTDQGLWRFQSVCFSRFGNLLETAVAFVVRSDAGYSAGELKEALGVKTKHALTQLVRDDRLQREKIGAAYVYFSAEKSLARRQRRARNIHARASSASLIVRNPDLAIEEAKATILLFSSMLNEKQRRLYAGLEALKLGHGGDAHIASLLGMDPHTVARGRQELVNANCGGNRVRASGGGRLSQEKKRRK
ncbi:MAG: hypothetical protein EOM12_10735 [Verrucomicrobiae bacterium]|nr:hypothetical protein [Verrucomicrobiae bacterium]